MLKISKLFKLLLSSLDAKNDTRFDIIGKKRTRFFHDLD